MSVPAVATPEERAVVRARIDADVARDPGRAADFRLLLAADPALFASLFAVTYDPRRARDRYVPLVLFPRQRELVAWVADRERAREDGVVEKSREVGVTWTLVAIAAHRFVFDAGAKVGFGSRKEALVDQAGNPDAILEKVRILLRRLPPWLLAPDAWESHHLRLLNRASGASITGEAGDHIGRGGRSTLYFVDEAAFLPHPTLVEGALASNANTVIWASTAAGYRDWFHARAERGSTFTFRWTDDPRKGEAWEREQRAKLDPAVYAREVGIDYGAARERLVVERPWVEAARKLGATLRAAGIAAPPPAGPVVAGLDVGLEGDRSAYVARRGPWIIRTEAWNARRGRAVADRALALADADGAVRVAIDAIGLGRGVAELLEEEARRRRRAALRDAPEDPAEAALYREILRGQGAAGTRAVDGFALDMVNVGSRASDAVWPDGARACERFANLRAELWWTLRDGLAYAAELAAAVEAGDVGDADAIDWGRLLLLPDDADLARDLGALSYGERNGRIVIEGKRDLRRRGLRSPDRADALALTFAPRTSARLAVREIGVL